MNDNEIKLPAKYSDIKSASERIRFSMPSDLQTGSLLRTLVATKPNGAFLELGTGTGLSLSWIVEGMDAQSEVISIDNNERYLSVAREYFSSDPRVKIVCEDANVWIMTNSSLSFDLIFADAWPGKYETIDETLDLLKVGGLYVIDDMLAQPNWPEGHHKNVEKLVQYLDSKNDMKITKLNWSTGIILVTKIRS